MDDEVELRRLRERVYGAGGAPATPAMLERLAELEDRSRPPLGDIDRLAPADPTTAPPEPDRVDDPERLDEPERSYEDVDAAAPASRPVLRGVLTAVGAVALLGVGFAVGSAATASMPGDPAATADPAAAMYPELTFPQTIEDAISADVLRDSAIDSGSTRFIGTVNDFDIFLAQPADGIGRCIVTFTAIDDRPWSAGCASGTQEGAAVFGIDDRLTVAIGDPDDSEIEGIPIRLSESVTAYVAR
ncbi:hypothetical protein [Microbacterium sp. Leaf151]|uniref:hypothetical protein n=1 Tax=Microbacterium sp. Leaf151 TaxID=1736276 RepID=UPI0006F89C53|nr:hypothetical protein [Microbacterium sp. Leaf151]KQR26001.1 hypothetical protein ASF76_01630 [Microbacterium sp. Leaf151]